MSNQSFFEIALGSSFSRELARRHSNRRSLSSYSQPTKTELHNSYDLLSAAIMTRMSRPSPIRLRTLPSFKSKPIASLTQATRGSADGLLQRTTGASKTVNQARHNPYPPRSAKHSRLPQRPRPLALHPLHCDCDYCDDMGVVHLSRWITSAIHEYLFVDDDNRSERIRNYRPSDDHLRLVSNVMSMYKVDPSVIFVALYYMSILLPNGMVDLWLRQVAEEDLIARVFCLGIILALKWCTDPDPILVNRVWFTICPTAPPYKEFEKQALQLLDYNLNICAEEWDAWTYGLMNTLRRPSGYGDDEGKRVALVLLSEVMSKESLKNSRSQSTRMPCTVSAQASFSTFLLRGLDVLPSQSQPITPIGGYLSPMIADRRRVILPPPTSLGTIAMLGAFGQPLEAPLQVSVAV